MSAGPPGSRTPRSVRPRICAGTDVAAPDRILERDPERMQVAHGVDHRQHRAGEHAVLAHDDAARALDLDVAELIGARGLGRSRGCVGDERDAPGSGRPDQAHGLVGQVVAVDDHLHEHVGPGERDSDDARIARAERTHRVEQVRNGRDPRGRMPHAPVLPSHSCGRRRRRCYARADAGSARPRRAARVRACTT